MHVPLRVPRLFRHDEGAPHAINGWHVRVSRLVVTLVCYSLPMRVIRKWLIGDRYLFVRLDLFVCDPDVNIQWHHCRERHCKAELPMDMCRQVQAAPTARQLGF